MGDLRGLIAAYRLEILGVSLSVERLGEDQGFLARLSEFLFLLVLRSWYNLWVDGGSLCYFFFTSYCFLCELLIVCFE